MTSSSNPRKERVRCAKVWRTASNSSSKEEPCSGVSCVCIFFASRVVASHTSETKTALKSQDRAHFFQHVQSVAKAVTIVNILFIYNTLSGSSHALQRRQKSFSYKRDWLLNGFP